MIDQVSLRIRGGNGGNGAVSFRREKFVPKGGPDGGDGGDGGSVILVADPSLNTLWSFRGRRLLETESGEPGRGKNQHGRSGTDLVALVPVGTLVKDEGGEVLADLTQAGRRVVVAEGGRGGKGNARYTSPTQRAPRFAQRGEKGVEREVILELKLLADVGIVGYPNVGKSSLLAAVSAARPKIADYPFTTLEPVLGVVSLGPQAAVWGDIPGLIEGAHRGAGLGDQFLRHIERARVLVHVLDGSRPDPRGDWERLNRELVLYNPQLGEKPQVLAVNKLDLPEVRERRQEIEKALKPLGLPLFFISAAAREGLAPLVARTFQMLEEFQATAPEAAPELPVIQLRPKETAQVSRQGEAFRVTHPTAERVVAMADLSQLEAVRQLWRELTRMGVVRALRQAGAQDGARVRIGAAELEWRVPLARRRSKR
ncbi:MAG: GTPase ObgE [Chloroflexi bacterium]|nr:GTPase ObgE [Chloroflexota bacterium]